MQVCTPLHVAGFLREERGELPFISVLVINHCFNYDSEELYIKLFAACGNLNTYSLSLNLLWPSAGQQVRPFDICATNATFSDLFTSSNMK